MPILDGAVKAGPSEESPVETPMLTPAGWVTFATLAQTEAQAQRWLEELEATPPCCEKCGAPKEVARKEPMLLAFSSADEWVVWVADLRCEKDGEGDQALMTFAPQKIALKKQADG